MTVTDGAGEAYGPGPMADAARYLPGKTAKVRRARGRPSRSGGVEPAGPNRIRFDLTIGEKRIRPTKQWAATEKNLHSARQLLVWLRRRIAEGTFVLADEFPEFAARHGARTPVTAKTCVNVIDEFLRHLEAKSARRKGLSPATFEDYRQTLNRVWRPHIGECMVTKVTPSLLRGVADQQCPSARAYNKAIGVIKKLFDFCLIDLPSHANPAVLVERAKISKRRPDPFGVRDAETLIAKLHEDWGPAQGNFDELRFFTGLRTCEEIALNVDDYDRENRRLNISKTRVRGHERYQTKNGRDRSVKLCPRAVNVLERHLRLRDELVDRGIIEHDSLFFTDSGRPIRNLGVTGRRWRKTIIDLKIRYRSPYVARHTSVSWNLMIGREPQWVAKQHGHHERTMWTKYASWIKDTDRSECNKIRCARHSTSAGASLARMRRSDARFPKSDSKYDEVASFASSTRDVK